MDICLYIGLRKITKDSSLKSCPLLFWSIWFPKGPQLRGGGDDGEAESPYLLAGMDGLSIQTSDSKGKFSRGAFPLERVAAAGKRVRVLFEPDWKSLEIPKTAVFSLMPNPPYKD